jgi:hypothetical protein
MPPTPDDYAVCRTWGHAWDPGWEPSSITPGPVWRNRLSARCTRCTTERIDAIGALGDVMQRHYNYPDGYRYARNERPTRSEFRLMLLKRDH